MEDVFLLIRKNWKDLSDAVKCFQKMKGTTQGDMTPTVRDPAKGEQQENTIGKQRSQILSKFHWVVHIIHFTHRYSNMYYMREKRVLLQSIGASISILSSCFKFFNLKIMYTPKSPDVFKIVRIFLKFVSLKEFFWGHKELETQMDWACELYKSENKARHVLDVFLPWFVCSYCPSHGLGCLSCFPCFSCFTHGILSWFPAFT